MIQERRLPTSTGTTSVRLRRHGNNIRDPREETLHQHGNNIRAARKTREQHPWPPTSTEAASVRHRRYGNNIRDPRAETYHQYGNNIRAPKERKKNTNKERRSHIDTISLTHITTAVPRLQRSSSRHPVLRIEPGPWSQKVNDTPPDHTINQREWQPGLSTPPGWRRHYTALAAPGWVGGGRR